MFASSVLRRVIAQSRILKKLSVETNVKKFCVRSLALSSNISNKYGPNVYESPYADVEIPNASLVEYLKSRTKNYDDRVALISAETGAEYRYGDMWQQVRSLASALSRLGLGKGSTLALVSPNCPEFVISFLASVSTGAIVTTVNCLYTPDEMATQLDDSGASFVIFHPGVGPIVQQALAKSSSKIPHVISTHKISEESHLNLPSMVQDDGSCFPDDLQINPVNDVMVLPYSSGTTGKPKGVMLTHTNIVSNVQQVTSKDLNLVDENDTEVVFGVLPMFHIYGMVPCLLMSLVKGTSIVTFNKFDPQLYVGSLVKYKPTVLFTVPPILNFLAHTPQVKPEFMKSVKFLTCGAAPVGETLADHFNSKFTHGVTFQEGFGMTESSPVTHLTPGTEYKPGSCGKPVPNTLAKIIDINTGETLPTGGEGELCVKGPQIMKGYHNNEEATRNTISEDGWLFTGDIAKADTNGHFYIVDRLKELIKVKGFQVAPAELEDLLRTLPGVADVAVIGVPDDKAGELPRAYVVKDPSTDSLTEQTVAEFVSSKVSAHKKLAGGVHFIEAIPKSMTGKILRKDLKALVSK